MARKSDLPIDSMNRDWSMAPDGLPYSGQSVQAFIKGMLNTKAGAGYFDNGEMVLYLFKDEIAKSEWLDDPTKVGLIIASVPLSFDTTQKRIKITPVGSTTINATVNQDNIMLDMGVLAEARELGEPTWEATNQDINVRVYVDASTTGTYEEIPELAQTVLSSAGTLSVDVMPYIPTGSSRVRFYFSAANEPSLSNSIVWNITLAEMYIEEWQNQWAKALVENGSDSNYRIGGFRIVGTLSKTLHIDIATATTVVASYTRDIGSTEAIERPYFFGRVEGLALTSPTSESGEDLPALTTGIYNVKVWLTSGDLSTDDTPITYNIMYVAPGDENTANIVVMNYSGNEVNNYDEAAHLCDYAVYNGGETYATPTITITPYISGTAGTTITQEVQVFSETPQALNHNINLVTNSNQLRIDYRVTMPDNYQEGSSRVNNTEIFPSEDGAVFYLNTSLRSNGESNKEIVFNSANNSSVPLSSVEWAKMSWVDGIDGWTEDEDGRKCLMLPARTRLTIPPSAFRFLSGEDVTFEFCYKVKNVSDYTENIITIAQNPESEGFMGIRIKPTNVTVHSGSDMSSRNDVYQGTNLSDEDTVHLVIVIQKNVEVGYNLVTGYVNGTKNFQFSYTPNTIWANTYASAVFGSDTADLCLYMMRAYSKPLSSSGAENNWLNSLTTRADKVSYKQFIQSVLKPSTRQISYETIKNNAKYNFFVIEMTSGSSGVPSTSYPDGGRSNIEMHYGVDANGNDRSSWDWKIYDVETKGQGTTSMNYWLWNIRWRIDKTDSSKKRLVSYFDVPSTSSGVREFNELTPESSKTVWFDGEGNHPGVKRITAKINFASSMQSHKMGATMAYTLLHDAIEDGAILNEAQLEAQAQDLPMPTVAVYQYPAFGFKKVVDSGGVPSYEFIGIFTIGPDKGDKPTFGFDLVEDDLVSLEGVDHTPQMARFAVPWDEQTAYYVNSSGDGFIATKAPSGNYVGALEVGNAQSAETDDADAAMQVMISTFKPAYDVVYNNSTLIFPISLSDETWGGNNAAAVLANINANIEAFQKTQYKETRLKYADMEFWIQGEYHLYHYEYESQEYVSGYKSNGAYSNPLDLRTDTGVTDSQLSGYTLDEQNDMFKEIRRARFVANAPAVWSMRELVFNYVYLLVFAATDNFAKNQYPVYMGGKWGFRQDDLDTIEDIDNAGGQTKPADIEFEDASDGSPRFAGSNSALWNLVHESLWGDFTSGGVSYSGIKTMGREMIETMSLLSGGNDTYDGFIKFFDKYFWGRAQKYLPQSAYNLDAQLKYEGAWLTGRTFAVDPLRQSLGDHYQAERLWVRRRALYCMSLFGAGAFGVYSDQYLGRIQFRPDSLGSMTVTVAESMYPALIIGDNDVRPTARKFGGESYEFTSLTGDGNTVYTLQAVHYLTSLGDLKDLRVGNDDGGRFNVTGKKLRVFKMGDATESVNTNVSTLNIDSTYGLPCLEIVDLRNAESLSGSLDLTNCKRVKEVYADGTTISNIALPRGSKIEKLHLSDYATTLSYQVVKYLSELVLPSDTSNITLIYLEECDALDGMTTLESVYNSDDSNLAFIRILWGTERPVTAPQLKMLAGIMQNKDKDGNSHNYNGVSPSGSGDVYLNPVVEGRLLADKYYPSAISYLSGGVEPSDSTIHDGMKQIFNNYFGSLYITYPLGNAHECIEFEDPVVEALCVSNWGSDGCITIAQAAAVTTLNNVFKGNDDITSFDELRYFTGLSATQYPYNAQFEGCDNLTKLWIASRGSGDGALVNSNGFGAMPSLHTITLDVPWIPSGTNPFTKNSESTSITRVNLRSIDLWFESNFSYRTDVAFGYISSDVHLYLIGSNNELTSISVPQGATSIQNNQFYACKGITSVSIPQTVTSIGSNAFNRCSSLASIELPANLTYIADSAFYSCTSIESIVIPSGVVAFPQSLFDYCSALECITISSPVTASNYCFRGCSSLKRFNVSNITDWVRSVWASTQGYPSNASSEMHIYDTEDGTEYTSVDVPQNTTTISRYAFADCINITDISLPSSITEINDHAFYNTSIENMYIPNATINGQFIVGACASLDNLTVNRSISDSRLLVNTGSGSAGAGTGVFYLNGDISRDANVPWSLQFKYIVITGDMTDSTGTITNYYFSGGGSNNIIRHIIIDGDCSPAYPLFDPRTSIPIMVEIGGAIGGSIMSDSLVGANYVHLKYNGIAGQASSLGNNLLSVAKVYVGDGSSSLHDDAILSQYLADSGWSGYSSKLDTWYNYVQGGGEYATRPQPYLPNGVSL